jgi:hypothetical protein
MKNITEFKKPQEELCCRHCGSVDIYNRIWYNINTGDTKYETDKDIERAFCFVCKDGVKAIPISTFTGEPCIHEYEENRIEVGNKAIIDHRCKHCGRFLKVETDIQNIDEKRDTH